MSEFTGIEQRLGERSASKTKLTLAKASGIKPKIEAVLVQVESPALQRILKLDTADANAAERAERTPQEQLAVLDERLGEGMGAAKERKRLLAQITERKNNYGNSTL